MDLSHHLRVEQFLIALRWLMVLVKRKSTVQILRVPACIHRIVLVDFFVSKPLSSLPTFHHACIADLALFALSVVKRLIGQVSSRPVQWPLEFLLALLPLVAVDRV